MKKIIFILTLLFVCIIITGCNLPKPEPNYSSTDKNYLLLSKSEEKYSIKGQEQIQSYNNFISSLISFSADLTEKVYLKYGNKYDRMAISPISLYMALAMATSVASEDAKEELEELIGIPYEEMCEYSKYLMSTINKSFYQNGSLSSMVNLSNSIWLNEGIEFKQEGLEVLKDSFYTDSYQAPFTSNNALANKAVKDFIFRSTKGLIDKEYYFDKDTLFLLINTMYLKDTWNSDGSKLNLTNIDYKFQNQNNTVKQLKLMLGHYVGGKTKIGDGFEYFNSSISYNLKLHFIKPTTKELNEVFTKENLEIVMKDKKFETVNDELREYYYTRCIFPEFDASFDEDMSSFFKEEYQLSKIFRDRVSNFNKITDDICFVKNIIHQSKLTVDRVGVEGSAITIIQGNGAGAAPEQRYTNVFYDFIVDKSFGFIITYYDVVLFSGVVNNL